MTCIEKFMFARRFSAVSDALAEDPSPLVAVPALSDDDLDQARREARAEGYAEGYAAGLAEGEAQARQCARSAREERSAESLARLSEHLAQAVTERDALAHEAERSTLALALAALRKALPELHRRFAAIEIEAMVSSVPQPPREQGSLRVTLHPESVDALGDTLESTLAARGLASCVTIVADADLAAGDCRISWHGGGAERRLSVLMDRINDIVARAAGDQQAVTDTTSPRRIERHG